MEEIGGASEEPVTALTEPQALTVDHDVAGFDCGEPALNDWLRSRALKNESRFSRIYVVCEGRHVIAYVCISAGSVERLEAPGRVRRNAPSVIPVYVIGRLAVDRRYAGKGLGADILSDALHRIAVASASIGIAAVLVHAKDEAAKAFYLHCAEFIAYPEESRTLYLPIETVVAAYS